MKKMFFVVCLLLLVNFCAWSNTPLLAASTEVEYYRISTDTYLYRTDNDTDNEIWCNLPATYFVKATKIATEQTDLISVSYLGITGFVDISTLTPVYSTPTNPYSTQTFDILNTANAVLWSSPSTDSQYLGSIPYNATEVLLVGKTTGEKLSESDEGIWYLCKFVNTDAITLTGYIHSSLTTNLTPFLENSEEVLLEPIISTNGTALAPELSNPNNILLIILLTIPAIIILVLIIKPKKSKSKDAKRQIAALNQLSIKSKNSPDDFDF